LRELEISEIMNEVAESGLKGEATIVRTVPTGKYALRSQGGKAYVDDTEVPYLNVNVIFEQDGARRGSGFLKATWKKERTTTGKLTRRASLYGQLLKALDLPEDTPVPKVLDAIQATVLGAYVTEGLKSPDGLFVGIGAEHRDREGTPQQVTKEEAQSLIAAGWTPFNSIVNVFKLKG